MAVDLPAPFSPMTPWIVPASTRRFTPALASTLPNCLVSPRNSTAGGLGAVMTLVVSGFGGKSQLLWRVGRAEDCATYRL